MARMATHAATALALLAVLPMLFAACARLEPSATNTSDRLPTFGWTPPPSEVMNLAIGQGANSQTPIRMAQFFSALAGNGTATAPHLVARKPGGAPETDLRVSPKTLAAVHQGLARVVEAGGSAHAVALRRWKLYGKTGTAQNTQDAKNHHAWFTGFAGPRGGAPEIVVAVIVEYGGSGSGAAAPLAARIADYYLNKKHGHRVPRIEDVEPVNASEPTPPRRAARRPRVTPTAEALPDIRPSGTVAQPASGDGTTTIRE